MNTGTSIDGISRRRVLQLAGAGVAGAALLTGGTAPGRANAVTKTFYLSSSTGSDSGAGDDPNDPWRTIDQLNAALLNGTVVRGDTVRFRAGDEFFGRISQIPALTTPAAARLVLTSYGTGSKPKISAYKICNNSASWTSPTTTNVWQIDLSTLVSPAFTGLVSSPNTNVGFIRVAGQIHGAKKWASTDLSAQWDFYTDAQYLYVYSVGNPTTYGDVRVGVDGNIVYAQTSLEIDGLDFVGSGGHAFRAVDGASDILFTNNVVHEIGGSRLMSASTPTRYGNGVEVWIGSSDVSITSNEIFDVYDVAVTYQGGQTTTALGWENVHTTGNYIHNCNQSFEIWCKGDPLTGTGLVNCSFTDNTCEEAGRSWGMPVRPDWVGTGTHLLFYQTELACDVTITGNTFYDAVSNYCYFAFPIPGDITIDDNNISLLTGTRLQAQSATTIDNASTWVSATGIDVNSSFTVL